MSKSIGVYVVHSETMPLMYSIPSSIKFNAVVFEVGMFRRIKLLILSFAH